MAAYYKVDVVLNSQAVSVGLPSPQSVRVTLPLVGPQGPQGPQGEPGPPGEVSGTVVWDNVTEKPTTFPPSAHTHVAADVTDFSTAAAAAAPVSSVAGRTGAITLAVADVSGAVADTDARLSDSRTPTAHKASHSIGGTDALAPSDIGAQSIFEIDNIGANVGTLTASRAKIWRVSDFSNSAYNLQLPRIGGQLGDLVVVTVVPNASWGANSAITIGYEFEDTPSVPEFVPLITITERGTQYRFQATVVNEFGATYALVPVDTHTHAASDITSGTLDIARLPVGATTNTVAAGDDSRFSDSRDPNAHAASHLPEGADELFDQSLDTDDRPAFSGIDVIEGQNIKFVDPNENEATISFIEGNAIEFLADNAIALSIAGGNDPIVSFNAPFQFLDDNDGAKKSATRDNLGLGDSATADIGTTAGTVAAGDDSRFSDIPDPSAATPQPLGTASAGTSDDYSRGDHIHAAPALNDLSNVSAATPSDNDVLVFDTATSTWVAEAAAASGIAETLLDAKGDLIVASAADTAARLAVGGTNGHALVVDSSEALGVKWAAVSGVTSGSVDNAILRADGTGGAASQSSDIVIDDATTSTQANVAITNQHSGQTNSALVLTPKGSGAFIVGAKPDGTSTGGNARAINSIDIQLDRSAATQVASGNESVAIGSRCTSSGGQAIAIGRVCVASGGSSPTAIGASNTASGTSAACPGGSNNTASAAYSFALGRYANANRHGQISFGVATDNNGGFASFSADHSHSFFRLRNKTTTDSAVELFLNGSNVRLTVTSGTILAMLINIAGVKSDGSAVAHYMRQYALKNVGGTTSEVYAPVTVGTDNAAGTSILLEPNDTNDALKISCTGIASEVWRWVATVEAVEISYGS